MLTRNYYKTLVGCFTFSPIKTAFVGKSGKTYEVATYYNDDVVLRVRNALGFKRLDTVLTDASGTQGIILGTGTTPPTLDDYYLSGDLITGITATSAVSLEEKDGIVTKTAILTITNGNANAVTVGEVAFLHYSSQGDDPVIMLDRTVLETPVTIHAGGVGQVTYTIRFNYPTA